MRSPRIARRSRRQFRNRLRGATAAIAGALGAGAALVGVGPALAAGIDYPDQGARAMARGGAFVARADDPTAVYYNPAGLAGQRGTRVLLTGSLIDEDLAFARSGADPDGNPFPVVENTDAPFLLPAVWLASDLGLPRATFALAVYGPNAARFRTFPRCVGAAPSDSPPFDDLDRPPTTAKESGGGAADVRPPLCPEGADAPQRYDLVKSDLILLYPSAGGAVRVTDWLDVGAVFQPAWSRVRSHVTVQNNPNHEQEDPSYDVDGYVDVSDSFTPTGVAGVLARPLAGLHVGLSVRPGFTLVEEGELQAYVPDELARFGQVAVIPDPTPATLTVRHPWIWRLGVRYAPRDAWDLELDVNYERWSSWRSVDLRLDDESCLQALTFRCGPDPDDQGVPSAREVTLPHEWRNVLGARLGGSYTWRGVGPGDLTASAGGNAESAAAPAEWSRLDFTSAPRFGAAAGAGYRFGAFDLTVAYQRLWHAARDVSDSQVLADNLVFPDVLDGGPTYDGFPAGNGRFTASYDLVAVALGAAF